MSRIIALILLACFSLPCMAIDHTGIELRGEITSDTAAGTLRAVLENSRGVVITDAVLGKNGFYSFQLPGRGEYRLVVWIDGRKQSRRTFEVVCRPGATMNKSFYFGKDDPTLRFSFPVEDPHVVDAAEFHGEYSRDVLKEYERSYDDYLNENFGRAVDRLESIIAQAPRFYGAYARLGMIYQQNGCYSDAEAAYTTAASLSPRSAQPLVNLASLQIAAADTSENSAAMLANALENLRKAISIKPNATVAYTLSGAASVKAGAYDDAEASFQRALEIDTDMPAGRLMLVHLYIQQQRWDDALEHLDKHLEDHRSGPNRAVVRRMRAEVEKHLADSAAR